MSVIAEDEIKNIRHEEFIRGIRVEMPDMENMDIISDCSIEELDRLFDDLFDIDVNWHQVGLRLAIVLF